MWKFALAVAILLFFTNTYLHNFLSKFVTKSHRVCLTRFQPVGEAAPYYQAAICGEVNSQERHSTTADANFLMVSSLQIIWLEFLLTLYIRRNSLIGSIVIPTVLTQYALTTGLRAAVIRTCLQLFIQKTAWSEKWGWPPIYSSTAAGVLGILLFPHFAADVGFLVGWIAATGARTITPQSLSWRLLFILVFLYPVFFGFSSSFPTTGLLEWLARPMLLGLLIPPSFAVLVFPVLHYIVDPLWWAYEYFMHSMAHAFGVPPSFAHLSLFFLWSYLLVGLVFSLWLTHRLRHNQVWRAESECTPES